MVLWAPVTKSKSVDDQLEYIENLNELEDKGYIVINNGESEFRLGKRYFEQRSQVDQKEMVSRVECPVLIIHGDNDNMVSLEDSKDAMSFLSEDSRLEVIEGMGHGAGISEFPETFDIAVDWFKKYL